VPERDPAAMERRLRAERELPDEQRWWPSPADVAVLLGVEPITARRWAYGGRIGYRELSFPEQQRRRIVLDPDDVLTKLDDTRRLRRGGDEA
jgi:hypothetical protein